MTITTYGDAVEDTYPLTVRITATNGSPRTAPVTLVVASSRPPVAYMVTDLGTLGGPASTANDANAGGDVAGAVAFDARNLGHAFRSMGGAMRDLGTLGGLESAACSSEDEVRCGPSVEHHGSDSRKDGAPLPRLFNAFTRAKTQNQL